MLAFKTKLLLFGHSHHFGCIIFFENCIKKIFFLNNNILYIWMYLVEKIRKHEDFVNPVFSIQNNIYYLVQ